MGWWHPRAKSAADERSSHSVDLAGRPSNKGETIEEAKEVKEATENSGAPVGIGAPLPCPGNAAKLTCVKHLDAKRHRRFRTKLPEHAQS